MEIDRLATQLAMDPRSKAFLPLAEEYCKVGMWEEAVSVLEAGLKHYPGFITAMVVLGRAYDQLKHATKARAVLEGAIKLSPENLRAHRTLMRIYAAQGLSHEAEKSCRVILSMNPKDEEALAVQASLGAQQPEPARDTLSVANAPAVANAAPTGPAVVQEDAASEDSSPVEVRPEPAQSRDHAPATPHAATIAQLESWLRSLDRQRLDRPTSGSNP